MEVNLGWFTNAKISAIWLNPSVKFYESENVREKTRNIIYLRLIENLGKLYKSEKRERKAL